MSRLVILVLAGLATGAVAHAQQQPEIQNKPVAQQPDAQQKPAAPQSGAQPPFDDNDLKGFPSKEERDSYAFGYDFGKTVQLRRIEVLLDQLIAGLKDSYSGKPGRLSERDAVVWARAAWNAGMRRVQAERKALAVKNRAEGQAFLEANKKRPGVVVTPSGLQYEVLRAGNGPKPVSGDPVKVNFKGTLMDGTVFDTTEGRPEPMVMEADGGSPGWNEGLLMMPVGSKWKLYLNADLGWGDDIDAQNIPPGATLIWEVELLSIEPKPPKTETPPSSK